MFKTSHSALKRMFTESLSKVGLEEFIKQSTDHKTAEFLSGLVQICKKERMTQLRLFQINNYNHYGFLFTRFQAVFYGVGMPLLVGYFSFEKMKIWQAKNRLTKSRMRMLQISLAISLLASFGCFYFTHRVGKTLSGPWISFNLTLVWHIESLNTGYSEARKRQTSLWRVSRSLWTPKRAITPWKTPKHRNWVTWAWKALVLGKSAESSLISAWKTLENWLACLWDK